MAQQRVPKKNIEPVIVDVKKPSFNYERLKKFETVNLTKIPEKRPKRWGRTKRVIFFAAIGAIVFFIGATFIVAANLEHVKASVTTSGQNVVQNFVASANAIKKMEPQAAAGYLAENNATLSNINATVKEGFTGTLLGTLGNFVPLFKNAFDFLGQATQLNLNFYALAQDIADIQTQAMPDLMHNGPALLSLLYKTHTLLQEIAQETENVKNTTGSLQNLSPYFKSLNESIGNDYLKYSSQIYSWDNVLVTLTNWLASPSPRHFLIFFENPAEIRPGGGFLGSYADLTIQGGQLTNIDVRDIYDPDGQLKEKVVPPEELQGITRDWGARDGNWFFDEPTSAKTVIGFLEASKMYSDSSTTFDGAISIDVPVIEAMLQATGPIPLPQYQTTVDASNILDVVQQQTEQSADQRANQPKKILQVLAPLLLQKLQDLSPDGQQSLMSAFKALVATKDITFYFKDQGLASFLQANDLDGSVYELPAGFWGSYLAVVNANVAGGKSDAFVSEAVNAVIDTDTNGNVFTDLKVTRTHNGNTQTESWWRAANKDFLQVFTEPNSTLVATIGESPRPQIPIFNYNAAGYSVNPDLAAIENGETYLGNDATMERSEFGKNVFGTWLYLNAGSTKTLEMRYQTPYNDPTIVAPGAKFTFIFERQSKNQFPSRAPQSRVMPWSS
ncbi:DUF4012 domain-containing protein, partial [Patescibacteria group bacterium]|nr:DUF4012 domain-containing protein [Patescibacteria group bacterium]